MDIHDRPQPSRWASWVTTFFGIGTLPLAPGTWASLITAVPSGITFLFADPDVTNGVRIGYIVLCMVASIASLIVIPRVQAAWGSDPSRVVIDEVAGMALVCSAPHVYATEWWCLCGFLLFRLFDIRKPWPANAFNRRHEAWAVLADDLTAATYTVAVMHLWLLGFTVFIGGGFTN
jgi:phosphatidylglycerophosphatase A